MNSAEQIPGSPPSHVQVKAPLRSDATTEMLAAPEATKERIAILVCHGMGQQVPFEALDTVARALHRAQARAQNEPVGSTPLGVEIVQLGQKRLARAELELEGKERHKKLVHVYEAYWAPLTEGKVTLRDVHGFLWNAGKNAIFNCLKSGNFYRWMFGGWKEFKINRGSLVAVFGLALAVLWALTLMNTTILAVSAARVLTGPVSRWPSNALLADLTVDLVFVLLLLIVLGTGLAIALILKKRPGTAKPIHAVAGIFMSALMGLVWLTLFAIVAAGIAVLSHLVRHHAGDAAPWWGDWIGRLVIDGGSATGPHLRLVVMLAVWALTVALSAGARWFLVQYVGDIAVYVTAHTVSKFWEIRQAIFQSSMDVARAVYGVTPSAPPAAANGPPAIPGPTAVDYDSIIIVGHSLGSVIAYDVLNGLILENRLSPHPARIIERTRMLLTFGSPLDKVAFIFRTQRPRDEEVREGLAAAVQPMIHSYSNRPDWWVNIHSPRDWISGPLEYFDNPADPQHEQKRIRNVKDEKADTPLAAHSEYWSNDLFADTLYKAAIGERPAK